MWRRHRASPSASSARSAWPLSRSGAASAENVSVPAKVAVSRRSSWIHVRSRPAMTLRGDRVELPGVPVAEASGRGWCRRRGARRPRAGSGRADRAGSGTSGSHSTVGDGRAGTGKLVVGCEAHRRSLSDAQAVRVAQMSDVIEQVIEKWHAHLRGRAAGRARRAARRRRRVLLADRLHAPGGQGDHEAVPARPRARRCPATHRTRRRRRGGDGPAAASATRRQVLAGDTAVLEFETTVEGKYVNGVDIIRCNDAGRIVEFRVMIRPLQADQPRAPADGGDARADEARRLSARTSRRNGRRPRGTRPSRGEPERHE